MLGTLTPTQTRAFAQALLAHEHLASGENTLAHADAVAALLQGLGAADSLQATVYLVYAFGHLQRAQEVLTKAFGADAARLAAHTHQLIAVQRQASLATANAKSNASQTTSAGKPTLELVRKMLLAFGRDLRVVLLRLASRLQTLRYYAQQASANKASGLGAQHSATLQHLAQESLDVFAPLANRLGLGQLKWEIEDLAFRFLEPAAYHDIAHRLDEKRSVREAYMHSLQADVAALLQAQHIAAEVAGRPKHIYSIAKKLRGKRMGFERLFDLRALRVLVNSKDDCYRALALLHQHYTPVTEEYSDYIARPKTNGYESLHTVVRDAAGRAIEIQIRTHAMHAHAEHGSAAHWAYKEAGASGYSGVNAQTSFAAKVSVLRQLLAWERDLSGQSAAQPSIAANAQANEDERIYVLTPQAAVVELPAGATAVDFAYTLHTSLGHRCRGARVDGQLLPLSTPLQNGQTVDIVAAKDGGPSRDWLNPELGFIRSHRARAKVRAWFNAQQSAHTAARGREAIEKLLQREGRTAVKLDDLATQLGFANAEGLFLVVGKDEYSLHHIEHWLNPPQAQPSEDDLALKKMLPSPHAASKTKGSSSGVLVVGVGSLLTQLASCCKPVPPDAIGGFVTRGKGVSVHRADCKDLAHLLHVLPERHIPVAWGAALLAPLGKAAAANAASAYAVDVVIRAQGSRTWLRDVSEVFAKEKMNVLAVNLPHQAQTPSREKSSSADQAVQGVFTVQIDRSERLSAVLVALAQLPGVVSARRR